MLNNLKRLCNKIVNNFKVFEPKEYKTKEWYEKQMGYMPKDTGYSPYIHDTLKERKK